MSQFDAHTFGPVLAPLLETDRRRPLDSGTPDASHRPALQALTTDALSHTSVADRDMAMCCISGVWLLHDYLDESHTISQAIETPSGSFWHGIMHRREGDFSNAKYWFRRVGRHPAFDAIGQRAAELGAARGEERALKSLINAGQWDPFTFVDLCEANVHGKGSTHELCLDIQQAEWESLFDHCYASAAGE
jgi:hypothetical protein